MDCTTKLHIGINLCCCNQTKRIQLITLLWLKHRESDHTLCMTLGNTLPVYISAFNLVLSMAPPDSYNCNEYLSCYSYLLTYAVKKEVFLARPAVNIAVNKIDIQRVRYLYSRDRVTTVWSLPRLNQSIVRSSAERKQSEWNTERCVKIVVLVVMYGFVMCKK